jgi:hypothetical protein
MVVAGLEIADAFQYEVEARVKGELLEQVVVEAGSGRHANETRAVEPEANANAGLGRGAEVPRTASGGR